MTDPEADDVITVHTLQTRLSELQTLWQISKRRESSVDAVSNTDATPADGRGVDHHRSDNSTGKNDDAQVEHAVARSEVFSFQPTKPASPPLRSPRPFHPRAPSMEATLTSTSGNASRESIASLGVLFPPRTPPTPSTSTPRARQKAARQTSLSATPERVSLESLTLPPLQTHGAPAALMCPQCNAKVASAASRYCSQCGVQLGGM